VVFWYVEGQEAPVASRSYSTPSIQTLPVKFAAYNNSTAPAAYTFNCSAISVHDSTNASQQISDGTYPWRKASLAIRGIQGIYGLAVQDFKDSGRVALAISANAPTTALAGTAAGPDLHQVRALGSRAVQAQRHHSRVAGVEGDLTAGAVDRLCRRR
jgi:hypothetical protein